MFQLKDVIMLTVILLAILVFVIINNRNVRKYITALRTENKKDSVPFPVGAPSPQVFNKDEESKELHSLVFEYSDSETINQFYAQVFGDEFVTDTKTLEISKEASGAVGVGVSGVLNSSAEGKSSNKLVEKLNRKEDLVEIIFLKYFNKIDKMSGVTRGLENVEMELSEIHGFNESVERLKKEYKFIVPEDLVEKHRQTLREKREQDAQKTIWKIETITKPIVLVKGEFKLSRDGADYVFVYDHPVNKYLPDSSTHITISFKVPSQSIKSNVARDYEEKISKNQPIERTVCGKIQNKVDSKKGVVNLQLLPIAVYY